MKIQLVDYNEGLCKEWNKHFSKCDDVTFHCENYFDVPSDCYVSPANSFCFLDGGIDNKLRKFYEKKGIDIEKTVQDAIIKQYDSELLVGQALYFPLFSLEKNVPDLIVAPTMRVPMKLPHDTVNPYLAMRAILIKLKSLVRISNRVKSVSISGLCTGIGQVPYDLCAKQMKQAYDDFWIGKNYFPETWSEAQDRHQLLYSDNIDGDLQYDKPKN
jgi:O-acetyl-ADP-ribose deacetylase (regulator of RNase III)